MVLADDDISTLRAAIEEGRRVVRQPRQGARLRAADEHRPGADRRRRGAVLRRPAQLPVDAGADPLDQPDRRRRAGAAARVRGARAGRDVAARRATPGTPLLDRPLLVRTLLVSATLTAVALGAVLSSPADEGLLARRARRPPRSPAPSCCRRSTCWPAARSRGPTASSAAGATRRSTRASRSCSRCRRCSSTRRSCRRCSASAAIGARELAGRRAAAW